MRHFYRSLIAGAVLLGGYAALQSEATVLRQLTMGSVTVDAVRLPLWNVAFAQGADTLNLENIKFKSGLSVYEAKRIVVSGLSSSRAEIDALLSLSAGAPTADRLARISAAQMLIPELTAAYRVGNEAQTITYKNIVLKNIVRGKIAEATVETTTGEIADRSAKMSFSYGLMALSEVDMPALARLYEVKAGPTPEPMSKIHGAFSMDNVQLTDSETDITVKIARISGRDFMGRTIKESWAGATALFADLSAKDDLSKEEQGRLMGALGDFLGAFDVGLLEATGIEAKGAIKEENVAKDAIVRLARMTYAAATDSTPSDVRLEGLEIIEPDGRMAIASTSLTGFSLRPTLEGLKALEGKSFDTFDATTLRGLLPTIGTYKQSGIDVDFGKSETENRDAIKATIREIEFTADKPLNGAPTNIKLAWQNMVMALPADSDESWINDVRDLGYKTLDTSFVLAANWNEATNDIIVNEVSLSGGEMGRIALSGVLGNVTRDLFSADSSTAAAAGLSAKIKALKLQIDKGGNLLDRILEQAAKKDKMSPAKLRSAYAEGASLISVSTLGNSKAAKVVAKSVADYIKKPSGLTLEARTKDGSGLTILEVIGVSDIKQVLEKVDIVAKTQ